MKLGVLKEIDLRECWANEATDFTPWLASEENLKLLSDAISMDLECTSTEEHIDGGRADILCKDTLTEKSVIIENQLTKTDPDHLGRIMSYAAALDAYTVIWIASEFDEQYRATIDWLNRVSDEEHNFFGIEIKLVQIGNSDPAVKFEIVVQPNGWSKTVKANSKTDNSELTPIKKAQLDYWTGFNKYMSSNPSKLFRAQKGLPQHWTNIAMGKSGIYLSCQVNSLEKAIGVLMILQNSLDDKSNFDAMSNYRDEFDALFEEKVDWRRMEDKKQSNICVYKKANFQDTSKREEQYEWIRTTAEKFVDFFKMKIKDL